MKTLSLIGATCALIAALSLHLPRLSADERSDPRLVESGVEPQPTERRGRAALAARAEREGIERAFQMLEELQGRLEFLQMRENRSHERAAGLGRVLRLTFSVEPAIEGFKPFSVVTSRQSYSLNATQEAKSGRWGVEIGGELTMTGARLNKAWINFDVRVEVEKDGEKADETRIREKASGEGSAIVAIGESSELVSVGNSRLMVHVAEVTPGPAHVEVPKAVKED